MSTYDFQLSALVAGLLPCLNSPPCGYRDAEAYDPELCGTCAARPVVLTAMRQYGNEQYMEGFEAGKARLP